jgi:molybdate transport system ATP-binding protein
LEIVASGINEYKPIDRKYSVEEIEKATKLLQIFNLQKKANSSFLNISFGEQRLLLLLRAIIKEPKLLILDEPFQGIDEENQNLAMDLLNHYFQENTTSSMVLITHQKDFEWKIINKEIELSDKSIQYIGEKRKTIL